MLTKRDPGTCNCDLTSNTCDIGCCCDWDCRAIAETWRNEGSCLLGEQIKNALPLEPCLSGVETR